MVYKPEVWHSDGVVPFLPGKPFGHRVIPIVLLVHTRVGLSFRFENYVLSFALSGLAWCIY